jgi:hypothetical protein
MALNGRAGPSSQPGYGEFGESTDFDNPWNEATMHTKADQNETRTWASMLGSVLRVSLCGVVVGGFISTADAANQYCEGTLANLYVTSDGTVTVRPSWRGDWVRLCNVNVPVDTVSSTTCLAWLALARSAVQRNSQTTIFYSDAPACNTMPTYGNAPVPSYLMMNN